MGTLILNGTSVNFVDDNDLKWKMDMHFRELFDAYLQREYGIDAKTFKEIIKDITPEKFI
jgi:hypothetical protein